MRLTDKDMIKFAKIFKELCNGKYKLAVITTEEDDYLYDLLGPTGDGFDFLVQKTIMASINTVLQDEMLKKEAPHLLEEHSSYSDIPAHNNAFLWGTISKKPQ